MTLPNSDLFLQLEVGQALFQQFRREKALIFLFLKTNSTKLYGKKYLKPMWEHFSKRFDINVPEHGGWEEIFCSKY